MSNRSDDLDTFKTDHLILLVGGNPLPNYVAARLLARDNATIWLVYSSSPSIGAGTRSIAENLEFCLKQKNSQYTIRLEPVPESDNLGIEQKIADIVKQIPDSATIGLNYTGGTKAMSTHSYRALESARPKECVFSYIDARALGIRIDRTPNEAEKIYKVIGNPTLMQKVALNVEELARLHGYQPDPQNQEYWPSLNDEPRLAPLCAAIVEVNIDHPSTGNPGNEYEQWLRALDQSPYLPDVARYPTLQPIVDALKRGFGSHVSENDVARALRPRYQSPQFSSCAKWFKGVYLEAYVQHALTQAAKKAGANVWTGATRFKSQRGENFDLDISAVLGYQLFALSCLSTAFNKDRAKEHFFEIFVRARQLGGDEARAALVCYLDQGKTQRLQQELERSWDARGQVRVFGRDELQSGLATALEGWLGV